MPETTIVPEARHHIDWLRTTLTVTGPAEEAALFWYAAAGSGVIPWTIDFDRVEEDLFFRLVSPPAPQRRTLSLPGARLFASELRLAAEQRHARAMAQIGRGRSCPLDLYALRPIPPSILALGPDHPAALEWLMAHWGTAAALRHVTVMPPRTGVPASRKALAGPAAAAAPATLASPEREEPVQRIELWSADWTPWMALRHVQEAWPALHTHACAARMCRERTGRHSFGGSLENRSHL